MHTTSQKPWMKGAKSPYQFHDITHFPDWRDLIVWDAALNNLASGTMIVACLAWLAGPPIYTVLLPVALTITFLVLVADLLILIADLGDPWRFIHSLRVMRFTSPLSVGVWGLSCFAFFLFFAICFSWLAFDNGSPDSFSWFYVLARLFTTMALIASIVVICYKGVVFSCSSQPGVKNARWLTPFMVSDSLLMGLSLYILLIMSIDPINAIPLILPFITLIIARCVTFGLLWQDVKKRARLVYTKENCVIAWSVFGVCGILSIILAFCGIFGLVLASLLMLGNGLLERFWIIGLTRPH